MLYSDITKPHLWPSDDLKEARKECRARLSNRKTQAASRAWYESLLSSIDATLSKRARR